MNNNRKLLALKIVHNQLGLIAKHNARKNMKLGTLSAVHTLSKRNLRRKQKHHMLNSYQPIAYKVPNWKYYMVYDRARQYYKNSPNSRAYRLKKGVKYYNKNSDEISSIHINYWKKRAPNNTWGNYMKRAYIKKHQAKRTKAGESKYNAKLANLNRVFKNAHTTRNLSRVRGLSIPNIAFYFTKSPRFRYNEQQIMKKNGHWVRINAFVQRPLSKNELIENIMYHNFNNN